MSRRSASVCATPKSVSSATSRSPSSTLPGLTSRWTTPSACAWASAAATSRATASARATPMRRRGSVRIEVGERAAAHVLRDDVGHAVLRADVVDADDVRVVAEPRHRADLALVAQLGGVARDPADEADRDLAVRAPCPRRGTPACSLRGRGSGRPGSGRRRSRGPAPRGRAAAPTSGSCARSTPTPDAASPRGTTREAITTRTVDGPDHARHPGRPGARHRALARAAAGGRGRAAARRRCACSGPGPTVAFGRLDALRPGFARACAIAVEHGHVPAVRPAGGHAAVYGPGVPDRRAPHRARTTSPPGWRTRFAAQAALLRDALAALGADARIGELPGRVLPRRAQRQRRRPDQGRRHRAAGDPPRRADHRGRRRRRRRRRCAR